jgi:very-short-patch-repair endonuclease
MPPRPIVPPELTRGPFTLREAQQAGLSRTQLQGASWRRVGRGLYAWSGLADDPALALAAVRRRLPFAVFSGRTAAWLHGLDLPPCDPVEATVPSRCGVSARVGLSVRRAALQDCEVVVRREMPATSTVRTVIDLGSRSPLVEAVVAVDMALHRRLVSLAELRDYIEAHARRSGIAQARRAIELAEPATESAMETRLRLLLVLAGLPRPEAQVRLHDERGHFLGRTDLYYQGQRLCLEYDEATHRDSLVEDNRRQNRLQDAGFRLLRFTAVDIHRRPDAVVALVARQLR